MANDNPDVFRGFCNYFPAVNLVFGDGRKLEFPDNHFNIVFSNAVVEHVGGRVKQRQFIHELVRVGKKAFISTPNHWFPLDSHTLIPFAHWLPQTIKFWVYRKLGREYYADINHLNLLTSKGFISLFPKGIKEELYEQKFLTIPWSLIAVVEED